MIEIQEQPLALSLKGVCAGYGASEILHNIDLEIVQGSSVAILGRNGVGKTTLMASLMGHTTLHSGTIQLFGCEIQQQPIYERARRGIGYVPQTRDIFPSLSVLENLTVAAKQGAWTLERIFAIFPGLAQRRSHLGGQLSGGEQQMLSIARALMGSPQLLLLDEPLEGLAPVIVKMLVEIIHTLMKEEGMTIILAEHSTKSALRICDHVVVLSRGQVVYRGLSCDLLRQPEQLAELLAIH